jgi:hypothetical protein
VRRPYVWSVTSPERRRGTVPSPDTGVYAGSCKRTSGKASSTHNRVNSVRWSGMVVIRRLLAVPLRFGGEEHSGWLPGNAATPRPTPIEEALVDFEIIEVEGGYILDWFSWNTSHHGDLWYETLEGALEQARLDFGIQPEEWHPVEPDG